MTVIEIGLDHHQANAWTHPDACYTADQVLYTCGIPGVIRVDLHARDLQPAKEERL